MKRLTALCIVLILLLSLCACGSRSQEVPTPEVPAVTTPADPNLGRYTCTAVTMGGMDLGPDGQWLTLKANGEAVLFLVGEPDEARWALNGTAFTLTMGGETVGTGTLTEGTITLALMGMDCTFVKEGTQAAPPAESPETVYVPSTGTFSCQGLYTVTYPLDAYEAPGDGLTDLISDAGAKIWFTKLDTRADANRWRTDMETKLAGEAILQSETLTLTAGEHPAEAVIYEDAGGWHAAVLVDFGRNRGSDGRSMAAACIYISAPTRETVWNDTIQSMASSLVLGQ